MKRFFCLLLLFPFISCYCYPLFIIHVANSSPEASEQTDFWIRGMLKWVVQYILTQIFSSNLRYTLLGKVSKGKVCPLYWFSSQVFNILTDALGPDLLQGQTRPASKCYTHRVMPPCPPSPRSVLSCWDSRLVFLRDTYCWNRCNWKDPAFIWSFHLPMQQVILYPQSTFWNKGSCNIHSSGLFPWLNTSCYPRLQL